MSKHHLLIICIFLWACPVPAGASLLSDELTDTGIEYYYDGLYADAIHELSKALLADPDDHRAMKFLRLMGLSGGIYGPGETMLARTGDLANRVIAYHQTLERTLVEKEREKDLADRRNQSLKNQLEGSWQAIRRQSRVKRRLNEVIRDKDKLLRAKQRDLHSMSSVLSGKQQEVARLSADLYDISDYTRRQQDVLAKTAVRLHNVEDTYQWSRRRWQEESLDYQNLITEIEWQANREKDAYLDDEQVDRHYIKSLRQNLRDVNMEKKEAEGQLALISRKLTALEDQIRAKNYTLSTLKKSILSLKEDIDSLNLSGPKTRPGSPSMPDSLQRDPREIRWIERKDDIIGDIKRRLDQTRATVQDVSSGSGPREGDSLPSLREKLQETRRELDQSRAVVDEGDDGYQALEQRLQDMQERLGIVEDMLQDKETQIQKLERRLVEYLSSNQD